MIFEEGGDCVGKDFVGGSMKESGEKRKETDSVFLSLKKDQKYSKYKNESINDPKERRKKEPKLKKCTTKNDERMNVITFVWIFYFSFIFRENEEKRNRRKR